MSNKLTFLLLIIISLTGLLGCGSAPVAVRVQQGHKIWDFQKRFIWFWEEAKDKRFEERVALWNKYIEGTWYERYEYTVWGRAYNRNWKEDKLKRLKLTFEVYEERFDEVVKFHDDFSKLLEASVKKFEKHYSDEKVHSWMIVGPTAFKKALATTTALTPMRSLIFMSSDYHSVMKLVYKNEKYDQYLQKLFFHEIYHAYHHMKLFSGNYTKFTAIPKKEDQLLISLIFEGLAERAENLYFEKKNAKTDYIKKEKLKEKEKEVVRNVFKNSIDNEDNCRFSHDVKVNCNSIYVIGEMIVKELLKDYGEVELMGKTESDEVMIKTKSILSEIAKKNKKARALLLASNQLTKKKK